MSLNPLLNSKVEVHNFCADLIDDAKGIKEVAKLLYYLPRGVKYLLVFSAFHGVLRILKDLHEAYLLNMDRDKNRLLSEFKLIHHTIIFGLSRGEVNYPPLKTFNDDVGELIKILEISPKDPLNDRERIVSFDKVYRYGFLCSSKIIYYYLNNNLDFKTLSSFVLSERLIKFQGYDNKFDRHLTMKSINEILIPEFKNADFIVTQSSLAMNDSGDFVSIDNSYGPDFSAPVIASFLGADVTFWTDKPGVVAGDGDGIFTEMPYKSYIDSGSQVINPNAVIFARDNKLLLKIKDIKNPDLHGTEIFVNDNND